MGTGLLVACREPIGEVGHGEIIFFAKTPVSPFLKVEVGRNWNVGATKVELVVPCYAREKAEHGHRKHWSIGSAVPHGWGHSLG